MSSLNKYSELEGDACPKCGDPIKPQWVACPGCGEQLQGAGVEAKSERYRFVCPGCGEKATSAGNVGPHFNVDPNGKRVNSPNNVAFLCKKCDAFVHVGCSVRSTSYSLPHRQCPVCGELLLYAST